MDKKDSVSPPARHENQQVMGIISIIAMFMYFIIGDDIHVTGIERVFVLFVGIVGFFLYGL